MSQELSIETLKQLTGSSVTYGTFNINDGNVVFKGVDKGHNVDLDLNNLNLKSILKLPLKPSPFGLGKERIINPEIRKSKEYRLEIKVPHVIEEIGRELTKTLGLLAKPYKLILYQKGDFFLPHQDTLEVGLVKTLVVILPTDHTGGAFCFNGVPFYKDAKYENKVNFLIFDPNISHSVEKITNGFRVCITYKLFEKRPYVSNLSYHEKILNNCQKIVCNKTNLLITYRDVDALLELLKKNNINAKKVHYCDGDIAYSVDNFEFDRGFQYEEDTIYNYADHVSNDNDCEKYKITERLQFDTDKQTFEQIHYQYGWRGNSPISDTYELEFYYHCLVNPKSTTTCSIA